MAIRPLAVFAVALLLVVSSLPMAPATVIAAPPDPGQELEASESASEDGGPDTGDAEREGGKRLPDELIDQDALKDPTAGKRVVRGWSGFESTRRRGLEAPVELRQPEPAPVEEEPDEGDGEPPQERSSSRTRSESGPEKDEAKKNSSRSRDQDIRIWPMRADSYTFTQAFGCVPQIANFYFPGDNCPSSAPVVHSGIDLGAPEGTPFYAAASGWVTGSGYDREVGVPNTRIIIQHDGRNEDFATEYLHWIASFVDVGDYVEAGEQIGEVGNVGYSTGPHLHFSVVELDSGEHVDPVRWLPDEPGSQGYRGIRPNSRARMRLPEGTTAGLPEEADPAPPPPPEREDVPESPPPSDEDTRGKDRSDGKRKRHREERRAEKRNASAEDQSDNAGDESVDASETNDKESVKKGKNKERTRKRERNKDGQREERTSKGEDGGKRKSDDKENDRSGGRDKSGGRHGNGNGNGNGRHNDNSDNGKDKQDKSNDRNRNDRNKPDDRSGADGSDGSGGDDGGGDGTNGGDGSDDADDASDDGTGTDGAATGDDHAVENGVSDGGEIKGDDGEAAAAQPADDSATQPVKKPKRRESS